MSTGRDNKHITQVVWFKRDLRIHDHAPLAYAALAGPVLPLFAFEPSVWTAPDMSSGHLWWVNQSIRELREKLAVRGQALVVRRGEIISILEDLRERLGTFALWSHEETGNGITYARDRDVRAWCRSHNIEWREYQQCGVFRRLTNRDVWSGRWEGFMSSEAASCPRHITPVDIDPGEIPSPPTDFTPSSLHQLPGEDAALSCLQSFLQFRGERYSGSISSPQSAALHGSRLSPYLAWGNTSMRTVVTATRDRQAEVMSMPPSHRGTWLRSLNAFHSRLHWHCHFIQKLESEPDIEYECFIREFNSMREKCGNETFLKAWCEGATGYPFIDACMRYLRATGWINFRMRAMLVSFAAYDLFLDWRSFAHFLARQFLDYEPGIHYPQIQMQSGTTGINTIRIYDPVKQGYDHDEAGIFVRRWVPELALIPGKLIHEPWKLSPLEQKECKFTPGVTYPHRIVEHGAAIRKARETMSIFRKSPQIHIAVQNSLKKHGSRSKRGRHPRTSSATVKARQIQSTQIPLFE